MPQTLKLADVLTGPSRWGQKSYVTFEDCQIPPIQYSIGSHLLDVKCRFCLSGARQVLTSDLSGAKKSWEDEVNRLKLNRICVEYAAENSKYEHGKKVNCAITFNDHPLTTWEDIQEVVRRFDSKSASA